MTITFLRANGGESWFGKIVIAGSNVWVYEYIANGYKDMLLPLNTGGAYDRVYRRINCFGNFPEIIFCVCSMM